MKIGLFITFEGGEGAGKTTLMKKLHRYLEKQRLPAVETRAPGGTEVGEQIRSLLLHHTKSRLDKRSELFLFLADRAQHVEELIIPALKKGAIVLCDRFNDSTLAYQAGARGFQEKLVSDLCRFACQQLEPDLTFYLDLNPKIGFGRAKKARLLDRIESEDLKFHQKIRRFFRKIAKKNPQRCHVLDASKSQEEVYLAAKEKLDALISPYRK